MFHSAKSTVSLLHARPHTPEVRMNSKRVSSAPCGPGVQRGQGSLRGGVRWQDLTEADAARAQLSLLHFCVQASSLVSFPFKTWMLF